jgi:hypothetical protein
MLSDMAKTPEQLAEEAKRKSKYTLYLSDDSMEYLSKRAAKAKTSLSRLVDEAVVAYIEAIKDRRE